MGKAQAAARADDSDASLVDSEQEDSEEEGIAEDASEEEGSEEEDSEQEDSDAGSDESDGDRQQRVLADAEAMRQLMADMDKVKMRLQFRFAAEKRAKQEAVAREQHERELVQAAQRAAEEDARMRKMETGMQTEAEVSLQQGNDGERGFGSAGPTLAVNAAPDGHENPSQIKKPAGLRLYDLVKASGFGLSRRLPSPVQQADIPGKEACPSKGVESAPQAPSEVEHQQSMYASQWDRDSSANWVRNSSQHMQDSLNNSNTSSRSSRSRTSHASEPPRSSGRRSSAANSRTSVGVSDPAISPRPQKSNTPPGANRALAALLRTSRASQLASEQGGKTEEQQELEAIQCLLFDR